LRFGKGAQYDLAQTAINGLWNWQKNNKVQEGVFATQTNQEKNLCVNRAHPTKIPATGPTRAHRGESAILQ
jgi:hypothetical protein